MNVGAGIGGLLAAALLVFVMPAAAQSPAADSPGRALAATCAACHGTDGRAVPGEAMVPLAGYPRDALIAQIRAFRDGSREATVMHQLAKGYSDRQIEALATWFAARPAERR